MPFTKGKSGNPKGRPKKGESFTEILKRRLDETGLDGKTRAERLVQVLEDRAEQGDLKAIDMILDRTDGKPMQRIEQDTWEHGEIQVTVRKDGDSDDTEESDT